MKVCIFGDGLVGLSMAKALINQDIYVDIFFNNYRKKTNQTRTIGLSDSNIKFYNKYVCKIEKFLWDIVEIDIYSENLKSDKLLNFNNKYKRLFSMIKNNQLYDYLLLNLKKSRLIKFKKEKKKSQ